MSKDGDGKHPTDFDDVINSTNTIDDITTARDFFCSVCEEIKSGSVKPGGEKYRHWLINALFADDNLITTWDSTDESDCVRLSALFNYVAHTDYSEEVESILKKHEDEFSGRILYQYCKFLVYRNSNYSLNREKAFSNSLAVAEKVDNNPYLHREVAETGLELVRNQESALLEIEGKHIDEDSVLSECEKYAEKALKDHRIWRNSYETYISVLEERGKFDKALEVLHNKLEDFTDTGRSNDYLERRISNIQIQRQRYELDSLDSELSRVETELDKATEQYRAQILQFIGFFAAILTVVLASVNIATELTFPQSGGLILVLVDAIVLAFGELNFLIGPGTSEFNQTRNWGTIVGGILLIISGMGAGILL